MAEAKKKSTKVEEAEVKKTVSKSKVAVKAASKEKNNGSNQEASDAKNQASDEEEIVDGSGQTVDSSEDAKAAAKDKGPLAKAGKRSAKAIKEVEEKQAKASRKVAQSSEASSEGEKSAATKHKQRTAEDRLKKRGKNYREAYAKIDRTKNHNVKEAIKVVIDSSKVKFDATVELHVRLAVDPKQADQNVRDMVALPAGTGKKIRIAVFGSPDDVTAAKKAGADIAAADEFLQQLDKGTLDFDVLIATPAMMPKLGKYARVLGPKGLMPNPKSGTVTTDVAKAVNEAKGGRVEYRVDSTGIVHAGIGKVSFGPEKLFDNAKAILASIKGNKPSSVKGTYILSAFATSTMGPSVTLDLSDINSL